MCGFGSMIVRFFACLSCAFGSVNVMSYSRCQVRRVAPQIAGGIGAIATAAGRVLHSSWQPAARYMGATRRR